MDFKTMPLVHLNKQHLTNPDQATLFAIDALNQTVLFYAVQRSSDDEALDVCKTIMSLATSSAAASKFVHHTDNLQQTALFYAAIAGSLKTVKWLVEVHELDATAADVYGQTALFYAARDGKAEIADFLISSFPPECEYRSDLNGQSPLFYAAREGHTAICQLLVARWPNIVTHSDTAGRRASFFARQAAKTSTAEFLEQEERERENLTENQGERRQRYRLLFTDLKMLEKFEKEHPEIAVWAKDRPLVKRLVGNNGPKRRPTIAPRTTDTPQTSWDTAVKRILLDASRKAESAIFQRPVEEERDGAVDYYKVVKEPMDLGTIASKLKQGKYSELSELKKDLALVWSNCRLYNSPGTFPRDFADKMETWFKQRLDRVEEDLMSVL